MDNKYLLYVPEDEIIIFDNIEQEYSVDQSRFSGNPCVLAFAYVSEGKLKLIGSTKDSGIDGRTQRVRKHVIIDKLRQYDKGCFSEMDLLSIIRNKDIQLYDNHKVFLKIRDYIKEFEEQEFYYINLDDISDIIKKRLSVNDLEDLNIEDDFIEFELPTNPVLPEDIYHNNHNTQYGGYSGR